MNSQVVQHVSHVAAVIEGVSIRLLGLVHLPLALEDISQVTPCCFVRIEENTINRNFKNSSVIKATRELFYIQVMILSSTFNAVSVFL